MQNQTLDLQIISLLYLHSLYAHSPLFTLIVLQFALYTLVVFSGLLYAFFIVFACWISQFIQGPDLLSTAISIGSWLTLTFSNLLALPTQQLGIVLHWPHLTLHNTTIYYLEALCKVQFQSGWSLLPRTSEFIFYSFQIFNYMGPVTLREGLKNNHFFIYIKWISVLTSPRIHVGGFYNNI